MKVCLPVALWISALCWLNPAIGLQSLTPNDPANTNSAAPTANPALQPARPDLPQVVADPQTPPGFPLDPEMQAYIEQLLAFWEGTSSQVTHYQCRFSRYHYDQAVCNYRSPEKNHLAAAIISVGSIRYRQPDKGMYEVYEKWTFAGPPDEPGGTPKYERRAEKNKEYPEKEKWICDGKSIFEYDYETRRLYEIKLPPEVQGEGLKNSPLPFVFGARAVELLDRYWIRDITPQGLANQYWLEAWPRRASDAQTYSRLEIHLSREPFLPVAIHMYASNYDEKTNPSKMVFELKEREINGTLAGLLDAFFIRPSTPLGWERIERDVAAEAAAAAAAAQNGNSSAHVGEAPTGHKGR